jgi:signal transduction histidine kinase
MDATSGLNHTNKVLKILDTAYDSRVNNLPESIKLTKNAIAISEQVDDLELLAKGLSHLSLFQMIQGEYKDSMASAERAIGLFQELNDDKGIADAKYNIASIHYKTDNYHLGLVSLIDCLAVYRKYHDFHNQARVLKALGTIYEYFGDEKSAVKSYEEAVETGIKAGDTNLQSNAFNPLSGIYLNQGKIEKAMKLIERAIQMKKQTGDTRGLAFSLYGRGKIYTKMKLWNPAESDFRKSIEIHEEMGERLGKSMSLMKIGHLYLDMMQLDKAKKELEAALDFASKNNINLIKFKANHILYQIAKKENDDRLALAYLEDYLSEKEKVINTHSLKIIESYDAITTVERLEKEASNQKEKADIIQKKNKELDSFFYRISHDLKDPLTSMMGLDHKAREEFKDDNTLRYFNNYLSHVHRMNNVLNDLMKFSTISNHTDENKIIDFHQLVDDCILKYGYLPNYDRIEIKKIIAPELNFKSDASLIHTILQNLVENAVKYARLDQARPLIKVSVVKSKGKVKIEVLDNGIGIDDETKNNIFTTFFRANEISEGSGLGLYILYRSVERLQGALELESELGNGSIFTVFLPYKG